MIQPYVPLDPARGAAASKRMQRAVSGFRIFMETTTRDLDAAGGRSSEAPYLWEGDQA